MIATTKLVCLKIALIHLDPDMQSRVEISTEACRDYMERYKARLVMPPIIVFFDGVAYWLADGWHRVNGAKMAGCKVIEADVRHGTQRDAILYSVGANQGHGLRRTREDKRRAVMILLADAEWGQWSNSEIARRCGVSHTFVGIVRADHLATLQDAQNEKPVKVSRGGTTYQMNTARIGGDGASAPTRPSFTDPPPAPAPKPSRTEAVTYTPAPIEKCFAKIVKHLTKHGRSEALALMEEVKPHLAIVRNKGKSKHA